MPTVSRHVSASASGSASKRAPTAPGLGLQDSGGDLGGRGEPCGFAAALGRRWRAAHNSTGPTTAKRDTHLTRKRSGLHLTNALLWSRVSGPPLSANPRGGLLIADLRRPAPKHRGRPTTTTGSADRYVGLCPRAVICRAHKVRSS